MLKFLIVRILITFFFITCFCQAHGQLQSTVDNDTSQIILISDMLIQIEANQAMNDLYNFKFDKAEAQFKWMKHQYSWHPLPYFLLGLSEWWKIMPNLRNKDHDEKFLAYMDSVILVSKNMAKSPRRKVEASFFTAAAYGFIGRLHSSEERRRWRKSATAGKNALKFLKASKGRHDLSPELLFGDALYNYFSVWVPENYPLLKPIMLLFPKGDKELGIKQLREVSYNAFYTRTEAQVFLMRILNSYEKERKPALQIGEYLHMTYPDNPFFHRYYARLLYSSGHYSKARPVAENIMAKIDSGALGYEATSGRYAAFFLGQINESRKNFDQAKKYYNRAIEFAKEIDATESGYYHFSLLSLGDIARKEGDKKQARAYYRLVKKEAKRGDTAHKRARERLKKL